MERSSREAREFQVGNRTSDVRHQEESAAGRRLFQIVRMLPSRVVCLDLRARIC